MYPTMAVNPVQNALKKNPLGSNPVPVPYARRLMTLSNLMDEGRVRRCGIVRILPT